MKSLLFGNRILQCSMVALYGSHPVLLEWHTLMPVARGMAAMLLSLDHKFLVVSGLLIRLNVAPHGVSLGQLILSFVPLLPCCRVVPLNG